MILFAALHLARSLRVASEEKARQRALMAQTSPLSRSWARYAVAGGHVRLAWPDWSRPW